MTQKLLLTKEQIDLLNTGTAIILDGGETIYYYLPFWFKSTEEKGVFECFGFEHLPKELTDFIQKEREYDERRAEEENTTSRFCKDS